MFVLSLLTCASFFAPPAGALSGRVMFEGKPSANALVVVSNVALAQHSHGWMERHRDVDLRTRTDAEGRFSLPVSSDLYGVTLMCFGAERGTANVFLSRAAAPPHDITLETPAATAKAKACRVRVVNAHGAPIAGALVVPVGMVLAQGSAASHELALSAQRTDAGGGAAITFTSPRGLEKADAVGLALRVAADGYAVTDVRSASFDGTNEIRLGPGCRVTGSLQGPDGPLANAWVDLSPVVVSDVQVLMRLRAQTDAAGVFAFDHVASGVEVCLSAPAWCNDAKLAAGPRTIKTPADGETLDAGRLAAAAGRRVAGNLVLAGGGSPKEAMVSLWNERGWLGWSTPTGADGAFAFDHVPDGGPYILSIGAEGLKVSSANAAYGPGMYTALRAMITRDHTDLKIELVPQAAVQRQPTEELQPRDKPMRGVESLR